MRRRIVFTALVVGLALAVVAPAAVAGRADFRAPLSHAQETGAVNAPGAGGHAEFWVSGSTLHYSIDVRHLTGPATQAHIHGPAARHADAGVAIWLCGSAAIPGPGGTPVCGTSTTGHLVTGQIGVSLAQLAMLEAGNAYVNVHTVAHPPGEVRGQILKLGRR